MAEIRRVLFTESSPNIGGQELQLLAQAKGLQHLGIETRLVCRPNSRISTVATEGQISVTHLSFRNSLHPPSILGLRRIITEFSPDAVISHSGHDANTAALAARLFFKRPLLVRSRTYQPGQPHAFTYNTLFDLTLVPSAFLKHLLLRNPKIKPERISVLYPGIPFEHNDARSQENVSPELLAQLGGGTRKLLVHAAMLRSEKGHHTILQALPGLVQKFPDLCYVIAGEGELDAVLKREVAERQLEAHVLFFGMVSAVPALMRQATLVLMPSTYEPLGMSQIEALGLGIPVVASDTGGIPETIVDGKTGLLAAPEDVTAWQAKLDWALNHPEEMQAMAALGKETVRAQFSMDGNLRQLLAYLQPAASAPH
ncbi:MAG: glycosyltransferase family 4 protein [Rhodocyclaceae bacterium]|nr:glycosyltransferase family 4 protein [Rhodocyclaceae bacterium]